MKTTTQILPGIIAIGWIDCRHLPRRVDLAGICGMRVPILTDIHHVYFFGDTDCSCRHSRNGAAYEDTASLRFLAAERLPDGIPMGFVVTDVNGSSFLIGSQEAPLPTVECEHRMGSPSGDTAGYQYEVKHVALKSLIPCDI